MTHLALLEQGAAALLGRSLTQAEIALFEKYLALLMKWQRSQRLVGSIDPMWMTRNLLLDSLAFVPVLDGCVETLVDVGSGAGIPGIPIKIVCPNIVVALVESRQRRVSFLRAVARELRLCGLEVLDRRIEALGVERGEAFDAAVMRCTGKWEPLVDAILPVLRPGGRIIASGPPGATPLARGTWVNIQLATGERRRFAVYINQTLTDECQMVKMCHVKHN
jgi:16S rRNA (guanine527-N7)-methyltransferase